MIEKPNSADKELSEAIISLYSSLLEKQTQLDPDMEKALSNAGDDIYA